MINYQPLYQALCEANAEHWAELLPGQLKQALASTSHGDLRRWQQIVAQLPTADTAVRNLDSDIIQIGHREEMDSTSRKALEAGLRELHPWRKGPYDLFDIHIDTEWHSDWKWNRLKDHIAPLAKRLVLDVGCGNGYHCWRMLGAGARMVIGIDPTRLSVMQFHAIRRLYGDAPMYVLPLGIEDIPVEMQLFDSVFSMGVLYHRRSPLDHLIELRGCLRPGGELILETLVLEDAPGKVLVPEGRYAKMRNVWFIPSCDTLISWMKRCGFHHIRLLDITTTSIEEQRSTDWMQFQSLKDFLMPDNPILTVEGLPRPVRAIILANSG